MSSGGPEATGKRPQGASLRPSDFVCEWPEPRYCPVSFSLVHRTTGQVSKWKMPCDRWWCKDCAPDKAKAELDHAKGCIREYIPRDHSVPPRCSLLHRISSTSKSVTRLCRHAYGGKRDRVPPGSQKAAFRYTVEEGRSLGLKVLEDLTVELWMRWPAGTSPPPGIHSQEGASSRLRVPGHWDWGKIEEDPESARTIRETGAFE